MANFQYTVFERVIISVGNGRVLEPQIRDVLVSFSLKTRASDDVRAPMIRPHQLQLNGTHPILATGHLHKEHL